MLVLQEFNREWWNANPMVYDWHRTIGVSEGSPEWFEEIDRRFEETCFFAQSPGATLFSNLIPYAQITGEQVLEVGCGAGAHAAQMARHGAKVTAIDLTPRAVELTRKRFELFGLTGEIQNMDAETMSFKKNSFDFVWSWGVIHHSANPEKIISEIYRILKPGGKVRIMVYHRNSIVFWVNTVLIRGILGGKLLRHSAEELANMYSDGVVARFYSKKDSADMFQRQGFVGVRTRAYGQKIEVLPVPRQIRRQLIKLIPDSIAEQLLSKWGSFLFLEAERS